MKINEVDKVTTLAPVECITAIAKDGSLVQIENVNLATLLSEINSNLSEKELEANSDLNEITKSGVYYNSFTGSVSSIVHKPAAGEDGEMAMMAIGGGSIYIIQLYFNITSSLIFARFKNFKGWSNWKSINLT